ncbi:hypothetical protein BH09BAC1_BH09BAC1_30780 [soil metagenome]
MKTLFVLILIFSSTFLQAQVSGSSANTRYGTMTVRKPYTTTSMAIEEVYKVVEQMPVFPGGQNALMRYLSQVPYPTDMLADDQSGKVYVQFVIDTNGSILNPIVIGSSVSKSCEAAVLKHVKNMPQWQCGKQKGIPVRVQMVVPIHFRTN